MILLDVLIHKLGLIHNGQGETEKRGRPQMSGLTSKDTYIQNLS